MAGRGHAGRSGRSRAAARVVEVYVRAAGAVRGRVASGYAVSGDLVLTSGHLIDAGGAAPQVEVRPLGETGWIAGGVSVAWCRRDGAVDAALLRVSSAPWRGLPDDGGVRWAAPAPGERVPCTAIGFPAAQERPDGVRDTEEVAGTLSPDTRAKGDRITVDVESPVPADEEGWRGMSGAALLSARGRRLLGVVADEQGGFARRRLEATRTEDLLADRRFAALTGAPPVEEIGADAPAPLDRRVLRPPYEPLPSRYAEAELLAPSHGIVPFRGRSAELGRLLAWCRSAPELSVALLTGEGGAGKSRLAAELCARMMAEDGWDAYVADPERTDDDAWTGLDPDWPLLLVFDYPETMAPAVARVIARLATRRTGPRVRVLLAARRTGGWWPAVNAETRGLLEAATDLRVVLTPDGFGPDERARQAAAATEAFAAHLKLPPCPPPDVRDAAYDRPLLVHVAALLALHGEDIGAAGGGGLRERLLDRLLDRERRRWIRAQAHRDGGAALALGDVPAQQAVALAALTAPTRAEARALVRAVPDLADATAERRGQVADWLYRLYPAAFAGDQPTRPRGVHDGGRTARAPEDASARAGADVPAGGAAGGDAAGAVGPDSGGFPDELQRTAEEPAIAPLRPDLLVERLLATTPELGPLLVALVDQEACTPAHLFRALHALRLAAGNAPAVHRALHALLVSRLRRLLTKAMKAPRSPLPGLLDDCMTVAADDALAEAAAAIEIGDPEVLPGRLALTRARLVVRHRQAAGDTTPEGRDELARALNDLGLVLTGLGRHDEAVARLRESVAVVEALPDSPAKDDHLATARHNLGMVLAETGRTEKALAETAAVVTLRRRRYAADPGARGALAAGLRNHAVDLSDSGQHAEAVAAAHEAVEHFTELARAEPGPYEPQLADALDRLAFVLGRAGRNEEALEAGARAIEIFRRVWEDPERRHPRTLDAWAGALNNHAVDLADAGRHEEAAEAAREAATIRSLLAELDPERNGPAYVRALRLLADYLDRAGRPGKAVSASELGAAIALQLTGHDVGGDPVVFAQALLAAARRRLASGDAPAAAAAAREGVALVRTAGPSRPAARADPAGAARNRRALAEALSTLAIAARRAGDTDEALAAAEETLRLRRTLIDDPAGTPAGAAGTAGNTGNTGNAGDGPGADGAHATGTAARAELVTALLCAADVRLTAGRAADGSDALAEALEIARNAADADPGQGRPLLASALNDAGHTYARTGRHEDALLALNDALALRRDLYAGDPHTHGPGLARTLHNLGGLFCEIGLVSAAVPLLEEAAELWLGRLAEEGAAKRPVDTAGPVTTVQTLANALTAVGRPSDARAWRRRLADLLTTGTAETSGQDAGQDAGPAGENVVGENVVGENVVGENVAGGTPASRPDGAAEAEPPSEAASRTGPGDDRAP